MGVHEGHRARLRQRLDREGLDAFQPHEVLEFLLFHAVARRDVNPAAHDLIDRFGSFSCVLAADEAAITQVGGVGARGARLIAMMPRILSLYRAERPEDRPVIKNLSAAKDYCRRLIPQPGDGRLWLMHLGAGGGLMLAESLDPDEGLRPRAVVERALKSRAHALVIASARAEAAAHPVDRALAATLAELLPMIGVTLLDSLILGGDDALSLRREGALAAPLRESSAAPRLMEDRWLWAAGEEEGE